MLLHERVKRKQMWKDSRREDGSVLRELYNWVQRVRETEREIDGKNRTRRHGQVEHGKSCNSILNYGKLRQ